MRPPAPDKTAPIDPFRRMRLERRVAWGLLLFFLAMLAVLYGGLPSLREILP